MTLEEFSTFKAPFRVKKGGKLLSRGKICFAMKASSKHCHPVITTERPVHSPKCANKKLLMIFSVHCLCYTLYTQRDTVSESTNQKSPPTLFPHCFGVIQYHEFTLNSRNKIVIKSCSSVKSPPTDSYIILYGGTDSNKTPLQGHLPRENTSCCS